MKKALQEFDEKIDMSKERCRFCETPLDENNISSIRPCLSIDGQSPVLVVQCLTCSEVLNRMIKASVVDDEGVYKSTKTEAEIRESIKQEGWTMESLRAKEEFDYSESKLN